MSSAAPMTDAFLPAFTADRAKPTGLRSLMQMWEQEPVEEEESEAELMVMLSGMLGSHAMALDE